MLCLISSINSKQFNYTKYVEGVNFFIKKTLLISFESLM